LTPTPDVQHPSFIKADQLEHGQANLAGARAALRDMLTAAGEPELRAAVLVRLARIERKAGRAENARRRYGELAALGVTSVAGMPAAAAAQLGMIALDGENAARVLREHLLRGAWPLSFAAFNALRTEVENTLGPSSWPLAMTEAADILCRERRQGPSGREWLRTSSSGPVLALWTHDNSGLHAYLSDSEREWLDAAAVAVD
jgi:hypothetical protein